MSACLPLQLHMNGNKPQMVQCYHLFCVLVAGHSVSSLNCELQNVQGTWYS